MVVKLNKGIKKDLAIVIGNQFASVKEVKVNSLKSEVRALLDPLKTLNKKNTKTLQKMVPKEYSYRVADAVENFRKVQEQKPKRPLSQYMNFSAKKSKDDHFVNMSFNERGKAIAKMWNELSGVEKRKFNQSSSVTKKYAKAMGSYHKSLKVLKTEKF